MEKKSVSPLSSAVQHFFLQHFFRVLHKSEDNKLPSALQPLPSALQPLPSALQGLQSVRPPHGPQHAPQRLPLPAPRCPQGKDVLRGGGQHCEVVEVSGA